MCSYWTYQLRLAMVTPLALLMHVLILLTVPIPPALGTYKTLPRFISSQRFVSLTEENPPTPTDEERRRHAEALWGARVYGLRRSSGQLCPVEYDPDAATWRPAPTAPVDAIPEDLSRVVRWEVPVWVDRARVALHVAIVSCCFLLVGVSIAIAVHDPQEFLTAFLLWELTWLSVMTAFTFALMWLHAWLDSRVRLVDARAPDRRPDQYDNVKVTNPDEYALFTDAEHTAPASLLPFSSASSSSAG